MSSYCHCSAVWGHVAVSTRLPYISPVVFMTIRRPPPTLNVLGGPLSTIRVCPVTRFQQVHQALDRLFKLRREARAFI